MRRRSFHYLLLLAVLAVLLPGRGADEFKFPLKPNSVRFAAIGDMGTGEPPQYEVAQRMVEARRSFPFDFVIMLGDNIYGGSKASDFEKKFELPYKPLLDAGVKFYASLGNHDNAKERFYKFFNMNGESYHTFKHGNVRFFALDSNYMDPRQIDWIKAQLNDASETNWKICFFHHPLYSSGRFHGPATDLRQLLEPLFIQYDVDVVFSGHDHLYERTRPIGGVVYVTTGAGGAELYPRAASNPFTVAFANERHSYTVIEISGHVMHLRQIDEDGREVDTVTLTKAVTVADSEALAPTTRDETHPVPVRRAQRRFRLSRPSGGEEVVLRVRAEGPFLVRLNEVEVGRGDGAGTSAGFTAFSVSPSLLRKGENTLAFEAHGDAAAVLALELTVFEENGRAPLGMTR